MARAITGSIGVSENGTIRGDFSIDAGSVDLGNEKRDKHLRSKDFFDVDRYPQFTYRPKARPSARAPVKRKVRGSFIAHGASRSVPLVVEIEQLTPASVSDHLRGGVCLVHVAATAATPSPSIRPKS